MGGRTHMLWILTPSTNITLIQKTSTGADTQLTWLPVFTLQPACNLLYCCVILNACFMRCCRHGWVRFYIPCRIEPLEIFDEFEEWHMIQVYFAVCLCKQFVCCCSSVCSDFGSSAIPAPQSKGLLRAYCNWLAGALLCVIWHQWFHGVFWAVRVCSRSTTAITALCRLEWYTVVIETIWPHDLQDLGFARIQIPRQQ